MSRKKPAPTRGEVEIFESIGGEARATRPSCDEKKRPIAGSPAPAGKPIIVRDGRIRTGRLAGLSMSRAIWILSWPILIESLMNSTVGLVDTMLAAGLSEAAADAIGGASYITWFLSLIGMAIGVGATALVSRSVGRGRQAVADAATAQALLLAVAAGLVAGVVIFFGAPELARMLSLKGEAATSLVAYLQICAVGVPLISIMTSGSACMRGAGDALRPLLMMVFVNAVNIGVSWVLSGVDWAVSGLDEGGEMTRTVIIANPFRYDFGIAGIAVGTLAAWATGALLVLFFLLRGSPGVRLRARRMKPHWHTIRRLVRVGVPNFVESFGMWFGNFLVLLMVGWLVVPGLLGAHIVAIRVEAFSFLPGFAMGMASATLAGQYMGAGRPDLAKKSLLTCTAIGCLLMGTCGLMFMLFPEQIVGVFSQQPSHLENSPRVIRLAGAFQVPFAVMMVLRTGLRGAGDTKVTMIITWASTYGIRVPLAWFLSGVDIPLPEWLPVFRSAVIDNPSPFELGFVGVWIALLIELTLRAMFFTARFLHGGWQRIRV